MDMQNPKTAARERFVEISAGRRKVNGVLRLPSEAVGVVAFAHGSGSGRFSPRNQFVAQVLQDAGLATLLIDLLEEDEAQDRRMVFDIELLASRLGAASHWLSRDPDTHSLKLGYFGASTGAAAALVAAARWTGPVDAVVSRGGRPDLAEDDLPDVVAPTLLIVGGRDEQVLRVEPPGAGPAALPEATCCRARGDPPLRGAGRSGAGRPHRGAVVPAVSGHRAPGRLPSVDNERYGPDSNQA